MADFAKKESPEKKKEEEEKKEEEKPAVAAADGEDGEEGDEDPVSFSSLSLFFVNILNLLLCDNVTPLSFSLCCQTIRKLNLPRFLPQLFT